MQATFTVLDAAVLIAYLLGVVALGAFFGRRQRDARDYFLGGRGVPWPTITFAVVATETSALTFISVPATAYTGDLWFLQLAAGYIIGRFVIAWVLLPKYFSGELVTAYQLLERRFGVATRRFASVIFLITRGFADSVRVFAAAIPIAILSGLPYWQSIMLSGVITVVYTYYGGLKAAMWLDIVQMALYVFGGIVALYILIDLVPAGWSGIWAAAEAADKSRILHFDGGIASSRWILTGLVGGAFLSMASHGVDHLIVQRLLYAPSLRDSRKALIASGFVVFLQFVMFLAIGLGLFAYYNGQTFPVADEIFPRFIVESFPTGLRGLIVAGIVSAMMSTVSSALNSLSSATTLDLYAPITGVTDEVKLMRAGKVFTLVWAVILVGGALLFQLVRQGTPVVVIALQIASFTYGGLLGGFMLAILSKQAEQKDAILGIGVAIVSMTTLWALQTFGAMPRVIDGLWFSMIGGLITLAVGMTSSALRPRSRTA